MKHLLIILLISILAFSCRSRPETVVLQGETKEKIVERLVPYTIPGDSAHFYALLECDSLNRVMMKNYSEIKGKGIESKIELKDNLLSFSSYKPPDTGFVQARDSIRYERVPYKVEVPVKVNELTRWQWIQIRVAYIAELLILGYFAFQIKWGKIFKTIINLIKK